MLSRLLATLLPLPLSLVLSAPLAGATPHNEHLEPHPHIVSKYRLIDIGETGVDSSKLSKLSIPLMQAPMLNNRTQGIANDVQGGFSFLPTGWKYIPKISGIVLQMHAINEKGDFLITLNRGNDSVEWMVWPHTDEGYSQMKKHLHTADPFKLDFFMTGFNTLGTAIGYRKLNGKNYPFSATAENGLQNIGQEQGVELYGIARAINDKGTIVGIAEELSDGYPFIWKDATGLEILKTYRNYLQPKGWVEFADMVVTSDDCVYGTFWIKYHTPNRKPLPGNPFYAYRWLPDTGKVESLDLQGMRIAAVNSSHTLVGSIDGKAAMREAGRKPVSLASLINPEELVHWELIEGTSINDKGEIVGYGTREGKMHLFVLEPLL